MQGHAIVCKWHARYDFSYVTLNTTDENGTEMPNSDAVAEALIKFKSDFVKTTWYCPECGSRGSSRLGSALGRCRVQGMLHLPQCRCARVLGLS